MNPVTVKELRGRMRGVRSFAVIGVFLALLGAFTVLLYLLSLSQLAGTSVVEAGQLGRGVFRGVMGLELVLVILIVPSLTAGAITNEKERQTYDLLSTTLLSGGALLMGKLWSALGYTSLLILAAIPLQSIAFLFGGVSLTDVAIGVVGLLATALLLASLGIAISASTSRTLTATVRVYGATLFLIVGVPFLAYIVNGALGEPVFTTLSSYGAYGNALQGVRAFDVPVDYETVAITADLVVSGLNPLLAALYTQEALTLHEQAFSFEVQLVSSGENFRVLVAWVVMVIGYLVASVAMVTWAIWRVGRDNG